MSKAVRAKNGSLTYKLTFDEMADIIRIKRDHSFLKYKKNVKAMGTELRKYR